MWDIPKDYFKHNILGQKSVSIKQHLHFLSLLEAQCKIVDSDLANLGQNGKAHTVVTITPNNKLIGCAFYKDNHSNSDGITYNDILAYTLTDNGQLKQVGSVCYAFCKDNSAYIIGVDTMFDALRQGIAYSTILLAFKDMQKSGIKTVYLDSVKSKPALNLYKKFNFKMIDADKSDSPLYINDNLFQPMYRRIKQTENFDSKVKAKNVLMPPKVHYDLVLDLQDPKIESLLNLSVKYKNDYQDQFKLPKVMIENTNEKGYITYDR